MKKPGPGGAENNEDFFVLAATAIKISLALKGKPSSNFMDIHELYQKAVSEEIPFHEWFDWLKVQFGASVTPSLTTFMEAKHPSRVKETPVPAPIHSVRGYPSPPREKRGTPVKEKENTYTKGWLSGVF